MSKLHFTHKMGYYQFFSGDPKIECESGGKSEPAVRIYQFDWYNNSLSIWFSIASKEEESKTGLPFISMVGVAYKP